jgi:DNA-binding LytR/AlgR family response regulator
MFNVVIVEDEPLARSKLKRLLQQLPDSVQVIAELGSVAEVDSWLQTGARADLIFSDIELSDGNVFQAYQRHTPSCPVVFITAYDQFMLSAFDTHGIAYLLKPYNSEKLQQAWQKFRQLTASTVPAAADALAQLQSLLHNLPAQQPAYTSRIPIRQQQQIYFLDVADITCVQADGSLIMAYDSTGKRHYLPYASLQAAEVALDPARFYRINRSELVQSQFIARLERYCKNTLTVYLRCGMQLKTSQSRTSGFNRWLGL